MLKNKYILKRFAALFDRANGFILGARVNLGVIFVISNLGGNNMKKFFAGAVSALILVGSLAGCGSPAASSGAAASAGGASSAQKDPGEKVYISVATNLVSDQADVLESLMKAYMDEHPNVEIDFSAPGAEYENMMKVKMAGNDLPDLWTTHGWAKARYGNYLADLRDREWAGQIDPSFKNIIADEDGKVYALPFDEDKAMIVYNVDVFEKYGITEMPQTMDDLMAICEKIKTESNGTVAPFTVSCEGWEEAQYFDYMGAAMYLTPEKNDAAALLDGSFDWAKWEPLAQAWKDMYDKGYINTDALTAKYDDNVRTFATGEAAMGWFGPYFIEEAKKVNPDFRGDIMPIPAWDENGTTSFAGGERVTLGAWKDSPNLEVALDIIDFCARPENVKKICESTQLPSAILGVEPDIGQFAESFNRYKDVPTYPYLDRVYLPSGMWDVMCKNAQSIMAGDITASDFADNMKAEYTRLRSIAEG